MGIITLRNLSIDCIIGLLAHERTVPQPISLDLDLRVNFAKAAATDDLAGSVDYAELPGFIRAVMNAGRFQLIESAADTLASLILGWTDAERIDLWLQKPQALNGQGIPGIRLEKLRAEAPFQVASLQWGWRRTLQTAVGCFQLDHLQPQMQAKIDPKTVNNTLIWRTERLILPASHDRLENPSSLPQVALFLY